MKIIKAIRQLTTSSQLVKPPLPIFGVSGRYTNALYSAAYKQKKLENVENDLKKLNSIFSKDVKFNEFMLNPLISVNNKKTIIKELSDEKLKLNLLTINLLNLMAENRRLSFLPQVAKNFEKIMSETRNELVCKIYTVTEINDASIKKQIEDAVSGFTSKKLFFEYFIDKSILGGIVIDFGDSYIDMSIINKLKSYSEILKNTI